MVQKLHNGGAEIAQRWCRNCTTVVQKVLHGGAVGGRKVRDGVWRRAKCTVMVQKLHNGGAENAARRCSWRAKGARR
ncbi:MAG TPA: hypothetical protein VEZ72_02845, partial [Paenibacillus sp.]|nr:hypothetical protein [Paenibacillus sp.]